jgi:hypothetical protein
VLVYQTVASRPVEAGLVEGIGERYRASAQSPEGGSSWQGDQHDRPTGPGVLRHCDGFHPDDLVAQRVSRRRQSERYATKTGCCRDYGLGTSNFRMDDAKGDAEDDAK